MHEEHRPTVTVYTPCHNYGHYLRQTVDSMLRQSYESWELLLIDDGSADDTSAIAAAYAAEHPDRIRAFRNPAPKGLQACANQALQAARGKYIMRLDADDFLDENALLVLASYLDAHPDVALVYPNFVYVDKDGNFLGLENRKRIPDEVKLLDLPAHGACTMVRRSTLKSLGGYNEAHDRQDGYELWLKVFARHKVGNVSTPLFSYRQHGGSLSNDQARLLATRRRIKHDLASRPAGGVKPTVVAVVPAKNTYEDLPDIVLRKFAGKPLIDYTLEAARACPAVDRIFVSTDDPRVVEHCEAQEGVLASLRPDELSRGLNLHFDVVKDAVGRLEALHGLYPDIVVDLSVHSPLRRAHHVQEALDTLQLYGADSVVSVHENRELLFAHGEHGLEPVNRHMAKRLVVEREALFVDNWAVRVFWRDTLAQGDLFGKKVGHIVMTLAESFKIHSEFDAWLLEQVLERRRREEAPAAVAAVPGQ